MQVRKLFLVVSFLIGCAPALLAQKMTTQQYIATYRQLAMNEMRRSGIPAAITLAQGVIETQSGNGTLCLQSNNHFGIKCKNTWTGKTVKYDDDAAQECFRVYETAAESYRDHSDFLRNNPRYAFLFQFDKEDYKSWAYGLKQAGYATNKNYPQQLIKVIEDNNLQVYTEVALGKISPEAAEKLEDLQPPAYASNGRKPEGRPAHNGRRSKPMAGNYPKSVFEINGRKVIYARAGTALIQIADQRNMRLSKLVRFNDLPDDRALPKDMFIFLQKKSKRGNTDYHTVARGESMADIAQAEGIRLKWLRRRNKMHEGEEPAAGQRLVLDGYASNPPALAKNTRILKEEDQEPEDFSPRKVVENVKEEIAKAQNNAPAPESKPQQPQSGLPSGMAEDLKKLGETAANNSNAKPVTPKPATTAPSVPATPAPAQKSGTQYHEVQSKETLYGIAKMYNKTVEQLQEWNNLQGYDIKIGQRLLVSK